MATLMKTILGGFAAVALLAGGSAVMNMAGVNVAHAQSSAKATVDAAIARGEIGEQITGYLGVVDGASPSAAVRAFSYQNFETSASGSGFFLCAIGLSDSQEP